MRVHGHRGRVPWPSGPADSEPRGELAQRQAVIYRCDRGHEFDVTMLAGITRPAEWRCRCGAAARPADAESVGQEVTALARRMEHVRERRTDAELEALLAERLSAAAARLLQHDNTDAPRRLSAPR